MAAEIMGMPIPLFVGLGIASVVIPWTVRGWVEKYREAERMREWSKEIKAVMKESDRRYEKIYRRYDGNDRVDESRPSDRLGRGR